MNTHDLTPFRIVGNLTIGAGSIVGSMSLPELAATASGLLGALWFLVQIYCTLKRERKLAEQDKCEGCKRKTNS